MIGALLSGIFKLVIALVNVILSPIDTLITNNLPVVSDALSAINTLIDYVIDFLGFVVDASGLSPVAIDLIIVYYGFVLVVPLVVSTIKLALKWYNILKP